MFRKNQKKIGEILVSKGLISDEQLKEALTQQRKNKKFIGEILLEGYLIKEEDLLAVLSDQFDIEVVSMKNKYIDWNFVKGFSSSLILDHKCFPVKKDEDSVTIAIINPLDVWALKKSEDESKGYKVVWVLVSQAEMQELIQKYQQYIKGNISNLFK